MRSFTRFFLKFAGLKKTDEHLESRKKPEIIVAARASPLSRSQVEEVLTELQQFHPEVSFSPIWLETHGDNNLNTSLRDLGKTNFFTKEIDELQLSGACRITIHSAKDLPEPIAEGLEMIALTKGVDSADVLVLREGESLENLPLGAKIGTSCERREMTIKKLRSDLQSVDVRGKIGRRLSLVDEGEIDGVVVAEAALIRLKLTYRNRIRLEGQTAPMQGQLAILARTNDFEMKTLFECIDFRIKKELEK